MATAETGIIICSRCKSKAPALAKSCRQCGNVFHLSTSAQAEDMWLQKEINGYLLEEMIGVGSMGCVYRAQDPKEGYEVAIKILSSAAIKNPNLLERFVTDSSIISQICHPNIVEIYETGTLPGNHPYIMMELLEGKTLDTFLQERTKLAEWEAAHILLPVCEALDTLHQHNIAHRDLTPQNIFLPKQSINAIKILDCGLPKHHYIEGEEYQNTNNLLFGSPKYLAPEQAKNIENADARSDIYSLGVILFELVTGQLPFDSSSTLSLVFMHQESPPPEPNLFNPTLSQECNDLILTCLAKEPENRYQRAAQVSEFLAKIIDRNPENVPNWNTKRPDTTHVDTYLDDQTNIDIFVRPDFIQDDQTAQAMPVPKERPTDHTPFPENTSPKVTWQKPNTARNNTGEIVSSPEFHDVATVPPPLPKTSIQENTFTPNLEDNRSLETTPLKEATPPEKEEVKSVSEIPQNNPAVPPMTPPPSPNQTNDLYDPIPLVLDGEQDESLFAPTPSVIKMLHTPHGPGSAKKVFGLFTMSQLIWSGVVLVFSGLLIAFLWPKEDEPKILPAIVNTSSYQKPSLQEDNNTLPTNPGDEINLRLEKTPQDAQIVVWVDDIPRQISANETMLRVPKDAKVVILASSPGYQPKQVEIIAKKEDVITLSLPRVGKKNKRK